MERIKALLAVSFFVANLIFAAPVFGPKDKPARPSQNKSKVSFQRVNDSLVETYYTYQPKNHSAFINNKN